MSRPIVFKSYKLYFKLRIIIVDLRPIKGSTVVTKKLLRCVGCPKVALREFYYIKAKILVGTLGPRVLCN